MPYPEDRVLVGVIRRRRDLNYLLREQWYRIPRRNIADDCPAEILAFYLSGSAMRSYGRSGIYYFAERRGVELARRIDLVRCEPDHPRAEELYIKVQIGVPQQKLPPVLNPSRRIFSFVWTTWDRFHDATVVSDLYRDGAGYVHPRRPE